MSLVFRRKVRALMTTLRQGGALGRVRASIYTIEWQKRGLPHAHIVLWLAPEDMPRPDQLDHFVRAEIPDADAEPELHAIATTRMVYGPCGTLRPTAPCMVDGAYKKRFPKAFQSITEVHDTGYSRYRRRSQCSGGRTVQLNGWPGGAVDVDNRWIVPYNPFLSRALDGHVNMEIITHAVTRIRYVIKYVIKGGDQVMFRVSAGDEVVDEIAAYQQGRYLNAMGDAGADTKLTGLFKRCAEDEFARTLLCHSVPRYYTWQTRAWCWRRRRRGKPDVAGIFAAEAIGRVYTASPRAGRRSSCACSSTTRRPRQRAMEEVAVVALPRQLRRLFAVIAVEGRVSCDLLRLWHTFRHAMTEDVRHRLSRVGGGGGVGDTDEADGSSGNT
ncbi:uncharacterized protein LOC119113624 [Pollicipes pollicipes]|uniref:uncharacterized protein LOC119113624 n=1 Tax=Pollicipes pollicipes TaxID=41117 RepID=UPI001884B1CD|nr:uncharacterized protein LOC119113624 [Pollicipes pollicipes]